MNRTGAMRVCGRISIASASAASIALMLSAFTAARAQGASAERQTLVAGPVIAGRCMKLAEASRGQGRIVLVALPNVPAYTARGFEIAPCGGKFSTPEQRQRWRDQVCSSASQLDREFHERFLARYGAEAALVCGSAELVLGSWQRDAADIENDDEGAR